MPAFLTHRAAGERVLEKLAGSLAPEGIPHKLAFYFGCQGPDFLFFRNYQPWRPAKASLSLGVAMHSQRVRAMMEHALNYVRQYAKDDRDELVSYIAGMVTHYAIDKNAHPFVYGKAGSNTNMHHAIEFMWDSYSAKEQWDIEPGQFDIYSEVMYSAVGPGICAWFVSAAQEIYHVKIRGDMIRQAQKHFARAKRVLANITLPGRVLIKLINATTGFNVGCMLYPEQRDESQFSKTEYRSMQEMIAKGVGEAAEMIRFALSYIGGRESGPLPGWFGDTDFAGRTQPVGG